MTDIVGNETVRSLWERQAEARGEHPFLEYLDRRGSLREYSYAHFDIEINRTANMFLDLGIRKGECVAVHMRTCPEFIMCLFALAKIGAVMVPMNDQAVQEECEYALRKCDARCVVVAEEFCDLYVSIQHEGFVFDKGLIGVFPSGKGFSLQEEGLCEFWELQPTQPSELKEYRPLSSNDLVEILFTSGTTSRPKGVELTHANIIFSGIYGIWEVSLTERDRVLSTMPACHSNFQLAALTPVVVAGATLIAIEKYSARNFWQQIRSYRASVTQCVAMMVRTLMLQPETANEKDHCLREILYFLPIADEEKDAFEKRYGVRLMNTYGSTESLTWVLTDLPYGERKWPSVGRVGLSYEVKIADDEGCELPPCQVGEIMIKGVRGRTIMKGYHKDEQATAEAFDEHGWFRSGDKGYQDESGWFYFMDRKVNMIKRSGENVSTTEIEAILEGHPKVAEAAVIGVPDPIRDQAVKAFILPVEGESVTEREIVEYCTKHMAAFKIPSFIEIREEFPRTCSMKIEKRLLK